MRVRDFVFVSVVLGGGLALCTRGIAADAVNAAKGRASECQARPSGPDRRSGERHDPEAMGRERAATRAPSPELAVVRRLSLALTGSIPSLEELRQYEARPPEGRIESWLDDLLRDRRAADYLAERFARALVGNEDGPFLVFRRRRFSTWLSDAILANRPYDALVRDLIADQGLWTDHPATNFVSVTYTEDTKTPDPERLAARVSRAFLGIRLDCAQCHDHPFQPWKQADFRGLAAYFGGVYSGLRGIRDQESTYKPLDRKTKQPTDVEPRVPFLPELATSTGRPREQLAQWIVHPANPNLSRATVNRMWALLFGRPLVEPVDDLPVGGELPPALDLLAADFRTHGYDLHRLVPRDRGHRALQTRQRGRRVDRFGRDARRKLGRVSADATAARTGCRSTLPGGVACDPGAAITLVRPLRALHRPQ